MADDNVKELRSPHISAYEATAEQFKVDLYNLCVDYLDDDFPLDWAVGILENVKLSLVIEIEE